jgi:hypothetical protein
VRKRERNVFVLERAGMCKLMYMREREREKKKREREKERERVCVSV